MTQAAQPSDTATLIAEVHLLRGRIDDLRTTTLAHIEVLTLQLVDIKHTLRNLSAHLTRTEAEMALDAATMQQQLADATTMLANNFQTKVDELAAAIAGTSAASSTAVQTALAGFQPQIDALTQMGTDENNPVPPVTPVDPAPPIDTPPTPGP